MESNVRISRINGGTVALFVGLAMGVTGLAVALAAWISTGVAWTASTEIVLRGLLWGMAPGFWATVFATIFYFAAGYILGYVYAALFNAVVSGSGGAELGTKDLGEEDLRHASAPARSMGGRRAEPTFGETVDHRRIDR